MEAVAASRKRIVDALGVPAPAAKRPITEAPSNSDASDPSRERPPTAKPTTPAATPATPAATPTATLAATPAETPAATPAATQAATPAAIPQATPSDVTKAYELLELNLPGAMQGTFEEFKIFQKKRAEEQADKERKDQEKQSKLAELKKKRQEEIARAKELNQNCPFNKANKWLTGIQSILLKVEENYDKAAELSRAEAKSWQTVFLNHQKELRSLRDCLETTRKEKGNPETVEKLKASLVTGTVAVQKVAINFDKLSAVLKVHKATQKKMPSISK